MRFAVLLIALILVPFSFAMAEQKVTVRAGVHPEYSRIVFDWPKAPAYDLSRNGESLTLSFKGPADLDISAFTGQEIPNISKVTIQSAPGENARLSMVVPAKSRVRDFKIGSRIILDVYAPEGTSNAKAIAAAKQDSKKVTPARKEEVKETQKTEAETAKAVEEPEAKEEVAEKAAPAEENLAGQESKEDIESASLPPPAMDAHVITVTSTRSVGMAVFTRGPYLWLAVDDPEMAVAPQIGGPDKAFFSTPLRSVVQGGTVFRYPLPQGAHVYTEGSGLLWRVIVTPNIREDKGFKPYREIDDASRYRGGMVVFPMEQVGKVMRIQDPVFLDQIIAVTVPQTGIRPEGVYDYPEFMTLPSAAGIALVPKADSLSIKRVKDGMAVEKPGGLVLSRDRDVKAIELREETADRQDSKEDGENKNSPRVYSFKSWEMGGIKALEENETILMSGIPEKDRNGQVEDLLTLAKLALSNDRSYEALGYLRVAADTFPAITDNPQYKALRGAANALAGRFEDAIEDLVVDALNPFNEIGFWKSYTLAGLEDWQQAASVMPKKFDTLFDYPDQIRLPIALGLTEVSLRNGDTETAQGLLGALEQNKDKMPAQYQAGWDYLMGETLRQLGDTDQAETYWKKLTDGSDDLYRAKAGLSLTRLQLDKNEITADEAIDRLEGLRYAWRGDELETLINFRLGKIYMDSGNYAKGLTVLRNTVSISEGSHMGQEVAEFMTKNYRDLFNAEKLEKVSPLDAVTIYEEFKELTPAGTEGDAFVQRLAERLIDADLLERAADLLDHLVMHRLEGADRVKVAIRLGAVRLLDNKPEGALRALDLAEEGISKLPAEEASALREEKGRDITLLRARALSKMGKSDEALRLLDELPRDVVVTRLIADIAWGDERWDVAADAFQDLILAEDISLTRPLTSYQAELILNRAIALNLSGNRVALANLRERYSDSMKQTEKAQLFDVVSRPRQLGLIGSRESVTSLISEVDLFKDFLESYRALDKADGATAGAQTGG